MSTTLLNIFLSVAFFKRQLEYITPITTLAQYPKQYLHVTKRFANAPDITTINRTILYSIDYVSILYIEDLIKRSIMYTLSTFQSGILTITALNSENNHSLQAVFVILRSNNMSNNLLIENLSVQHRHQQILRDVSLNIPAGRIFGLLGDNGAGKTTLLKTILGINEHFSGAILYNDQSLSHNEAKDFGALIESPAIYPNLTAHENLQTMVLLYRLPVDSITKALQTVGLDNVNNKLKVKNFSLGMKQRLGIAMAIIHNPHFLILDEPTNGLDMAGVDDFKAIMQSLAADGMTIMITTHQITELATVFDAFAILKHGAITYTSNSGNYTPEELTTIYREHNN